MYPVIGLPPLLVGAVQVTVAELAPALALASVGAPGTVAAVGVTGLDGLEAVVPPSLIALTTMRQDLAVMASTVTALLVGSFARGRPHDNGKER